MSERGVQPKFSVLNTRGIAKLGGDDIDYALMKIVAEQFYQETGIDLLDPRKIIKVIVRNLFMRRKLF